MSYLTSTCACLNLLCSPAQQDGEASGPGAGRLGISRPGALKAMHPSTLSYSVMPASQGAGGCASRCKAQVQPGSRPWPAWISQPGPPRLRCDAPLPAPWLACMTLVDPVLGCMAFSPRTANTQPAGARNASVTIRLSRQVQQVQAGAFKVIHDMCLRR